jgi:protein-tyrosine phosphatase
MRGESRSDQSGLIERAPLGGRAWHGGFNEVPLPDGPGHLWVCGKDFVGPDPENALMSTGANTVVCLNEPFELVQEYPEYIEWLRANQPDRAIWHPVPDLGAPPLEAAASLLADLWMRIKRGQSLLFHCGAGIGRTGTISAGLLVTMGVPLAEATTTVKGARATAGPQAGPQVTFLTALACTEAAARDRLRHPPEQ